MDDVYGSGFFHAVTTPAKTTTKKGEEHVYPKAWCAPPGPSDE
jgi:hypothetical protein